MNKNKKKADLIVQAKTEAEKNKRLAEIYTSPLTMTAHAISDLHKGVNLSLPDMMSEVKTYSQKAQDNNLTSIENMLLGQMQLLHTIFTKAAINWGRAETMTQYQGYGNIALKAQNLCRMTAATLADMKNPNRTTFIKNTAVNQQVNFTPENSAKTSNELLSEAQDATMDTRGTQATSGTDKDMATVE